MKHRITINASWKIIYENMFLKLPKSKRTNKKEIEILISRAKLMDVIYNFDHKNYFKL